MTCWISKTKERLEVCQTLSPLWGWGLGTRLSTVPRSHAQPSIPARARAGPNLCFLQAQQSCFAKANQIARSSRICILLRSIRSYFGKTTCTKCSSLVLLLRFNTGDSSPTHRLPIVSNGACQGTNHKWKRCVDFRLLHDVFIYYSTWHEILLSQWTLLAE